MENHIPLDPCRKDSTNCLPVETSNVVNNYCPEDDIMRLPIETRTSVNTSCLEDNAIGILVDTRSPVPTFCQEDNPLLEGVDIYLDMNDSLLHLLNGSIFTTDNDQVKNTNSYSNDIKNVFTFVEQPICANNFMTDSKNVTDVSKKITEIYSVSMMCP